MTLPESTSAFLNESTSVDEVSIHCDEEQEASCSASSKSRKVPFRGFKIGSEHSERLLKAMLLKPPFDRSEGSVPERWMAVIEIMRQGAARASALMGMEYQDPKQNMYWNVEPRTCQRAWEKFKTELLHRDNKKKTRKTEAEADDTPWWALVRSVAEVEELEGTRRHETATSTSRKRSADCMEQETQDDPWLRDATTMERSRQRDMDSDADSASASEPRLTRHRKHKDQDHEAWMEEFMKRTESQMLELSRRQEELFRRQEDRQNNLMSALSHNNAQIQQLIMFHMQDREEKVRALEERARVAEDRARAAMERAQQRATYERQAAATEALLAFLTSKHQTPASFDEDKQT
ncbi:hypothetical protein EDD11_002168 [Mortierella claussenii]|nr:hypothetical protein EDD11_002168 [Mortierella claussenii]